jgi:hypothetical protein
MSVKIDENGCGMENISLVVIDIGINNLIPR